jgi:putative CRISPR-associated protein (TIGR02619 family)
MKATRNNLIVTCGASQLIKLKYPNTLEILGLKDNQPFLDFTQSLFSPPDMSSIVEAEAFLAEEATKWMVDTLAGALFLHWGEHASALGKTDNLFSAEIGTLTAMEGSSEDADWRPLSDRLVLLASETRLGLFSAAVARELVLRGWQVPPDQVMISCVKGLQEKPENSDQALANLANTLINFLQESTKSDPWRNILVMSGGFKSAAPCLTVFSLLFGIELVYIFELSDRLQSLHPRVDLRNDEARKFWKKTWDGMYKQDWAAQGVSSYLMIALQYRRSKPGAVF